MFLAFAVDGRFCGALFAVKVFTKVADQTRHQRFRQETEAMRLCDHPTIMRFYDSGLYVRFINKKHVSDHPYFVAEYLPATLSSARARSFPIAIRAAILCQIASALVYLSRRDPPILHRDIKPENIFLKGDSAVLGDLGLMKTLSSEYDEQGEEDDLAFFLLSTGSALPYLYRTPDLVRYAATREPLTSKSDVFQLGLVAAKLFTGKVPMPPCRSKYEFTHVEPLSDVPSRMFGERIKNVIRDMLEVAPEKRPSAAEALDLWSALLMDTARAFGDLDGNVFARFA